MNLGMTRTALKLLAALTLALFLAACGTTEEDPYIEGSVDELYNSGLNALVAGEYAQAADLFDEVERQHPYSVWATKAQLMNAYALYEQNEYDRAILALDRFIELHPGNKDVAYAYYLKALCFYEQIVDVSRDQRTTQLALQSLQEVVRRFPDSAYARDARLKIDLTHDHLAGKEMTIGRYYQGQGQYIAAIGRYRRVVEDYQTTSHVPEALHRLVECYLAIGVKDEAQMAAAVLGHNYPGSDWYADSYYLLTGEDLRPAVKDRSWLAEVLDSVF
jgi:outer membrane protein assembly factor BamD